MHKQLAGPSVCATTVWRNTFNGRVRRGSLTSYIHQKACRRRLAFQRGEETLFEISSGGARNSTWRAYSRSTLRIYTGHRAELGLTKMDLEEEVCATLQAREIFISRRREGEKVLSRVSGLSGSYVKRGRFDYFWRISFLFDTFGDVK